MWSPNELLKIEKQRDILSYITLQFFHFKKVPLEHCPFRGGFFYAKRLQPFCNQNDSLMRKVTRFCCTSLKKAGFAANGNRKKQRP